MKVLSFLKNFFGFKKNSKYVKNYLNEANMRSSIFMSFIIIVLEIWLIIRQTNKYIRPWWSDIASHGYHSHIQMIFGLTGLYWLFIMCGISMFLFAIFYFLKIRGKKSLITNIVFGSLCILWILFLIPEVHLPGYSTSTNINKGTTILLYASMPIFGMSIIGYSIYRHFYKRDNAILSIVIITCFAFVCLLFGIKVGYSDYTSVSKPKMVTCFLTMSIFVACLLIWKPYISILMLTTIFVTFLCFIKSYNPNNLEGLRIYQEGDEVNYITFLVSMIMITVTIYHQRVAEGYKDEKLIHDSEYDERYDIHNGKYFVNQILKLESENYNLLKNKMYLFINIRNFKAINDQKGFEYGDFFLKRLAKDVLAAFPKDYAARLADDHFVVLTDADGVLDKIDILSKLVLHSADGLFVLLKVGGYRLKLGENPNRAIDKARYACNIINRKYNKTFCEYDESLNERFTMRQYIVNHIDEAIEKGYITAHYQPVVWSETKELCGAEALARWIDPIYGLLSPRDFIPVLEEARLINKLDSFIVEFVCKEMRRAIDENRPVVPVSINFSRLDFDLMDVRELVNKNVEKYNIDKDYIHIEVTESAIADDADIFHEIIKTLQDDGYAIWLDDFGSGYSSLNSLKDFKFDVVKIDMKFLNNFETNPRTKEILDCIIHLASKLGMKTLTEGVETMEEANFLNEIGCGRLQGYLFGKPYKLHDFEDDIENKTFILSDHFI